MITPADVQHIAMLCRLSLSDDEKSLYGSQLNAIITYIEQLNNLDTRTVEPTAHVIPLQNVMRDDLVGTSLPRKEALQNAPDANEQFYRVPKIIE
jgi:aspartyl-tRNA(Asn)/glutamyl-tRNA(Gln) amidotransferase subunit C